MTKIGNKNDTPKGKRYPPTMDPIGMERRLSLSDGMAYCEQLSTGGRSLKEVRSHEELTLIDWVICASPKLVGLDVRTYIGGLRKIAVSVSFIRGTPKLKIIKKKETLTKCIRHHCLRNHATLSFRQKITGF